MATDNTPQVSWTTVSEEGSEEENKIVFENVGDSFEGTFLGTRVQENADGNYTQARFQAGEDVYFTNLGYSLRKGLQSVRVGSLVRITFTGEQDTGQASPMRIFRVEVAKLSRSRNAAGHSVSTLNS